MLIKRGNILDCSYDVICTTTNGVTKKSGKLVMGAGNARAFRDKFKGLDQQLGDLVKRWGNIPHLITVNGRQIVSFPTKHHWRDKSDLSLIKRSAMLIVEMADSNEWNTVGIPAPGVGKGGLPWSSVKQVLSPILDDRFIIHFLY